MNEQQRNWLDLLEKYMKEGNFQRHTELANELSSSQHKDESLEVRVFALRGALQSSQTTWAVWNLANQETARHKDSDNYTTLHVACFHGNLNGAMILIQLGAKPIRNKDGQTPLDMATPMVRAAVQAMIDYQKEEHKKSS